MTTREDEIRARLEAATPGPWDTGPVPLIREVKRGVVHFDHESTDHDWPIRYRDKDERGRRRIQFVAQAHGVNEEKRKANADFIAHAPEDIDYLLGKMGRFRAGVAEYLQRAHPNDINKAIASPLYELLTTEDS